MKYIAIIGFGVVGGGITDVIASQKEKLRSVTGDDIDVRYILDLRDFPDSPYGDRVVHDIEPILEDPDVVLVCETMGGSHPAYEFSYRCMEAGKSVVTSNKEVVANFGDALLACAEKNGVHYMFEASVGGGIPCLRPFYTSLAGNTVSSVSGIVNGTTNFILTKMKNEKREFGDVLAEAQNLGYAERNPSADIDGIDAKRKIIILSALASGNLAEEGEIFAESLRDITQDDLEAAEKLDGEIKYIASANFGDVNEIFVSPMIVKHSNPLSHISDVYNGIVISDDFTGNIMYYGRGAGRYPTAGAVMTDVTAILSGAADKEKTPVFERRQGKVRPFEDIPFDCYVRSSQIEKLSGKSFAVTNLSECEAIVEKITKKEIDGIIPDAKILRILY